MPKVTYHIVPHDSGWAYKLGDVFSQTYATREDATAAARQAAEEQETEGPTEVIEYQDEDGRWHHELSPGADRPDTAVEDDR